MNRLRASTALLMGLTVMAGAAEAGSWQPLARGTLLAQSEVAIGRIYNGVPTTAYPAVVGLVFLNPDATVGLCSGTLITPVVVVTAAHCVDRLPIEIVVAAFPNGIEEDHEGLAYLINDNYSPNVLAYADIALILLATPVTAITPMPLITAAPRPRTKGVIIGFGQDEVGHIGIKQWGAVRLRRCPRVFRPGGLARGQLATSLCWHPKRSGQDTCHGDSGGPLIVGEALAGITSGGYPDCPGRLSWDTNVALFRNWIEQNLPTTSTTSSTVTTRTVTTSTVTSNTATTSVTTTSNTTSTTSTTPPCGGFLTKWGSGGSGQGQFRFPQDVAVDEGGNVFVADTGNNRIQKFSNTGTFLIQWGNEGGGDGQLNQPNGIAVDGSGNVFVTDDSHRVQKFTNTGAFLLAFGWGVQDGMQAFQTCTSMCRVGIAGYSGNGQFNLAWGVGVDGNGNVFVADANAHRIQKCQRSRNEGPPRRLICPPPSGESVECR